VRKLKSRGRAIRAIRAMHVCVVAIVFIAFTGMTAHAQVPAGVRCTATPTGDDANAPHPVCNVKPVITHGPYISAPTDTSATIIWMTDLPSSAKVMYGDNGSIDNEAVSSRDGLVDVGTLHVIRLTGLTPGRKYQYRIVSTPVLDLAAYWPRIGLQLESDTYSFTTFDTRKPEVSFVSITDTHEDLHRIDSLMTKIDWPRIDFLVHTGDCTNWVASEEQLWQKCLDPLIAGGMQHSTPLIFARGNHDTRGAYARELARDIPIEGGRFYYTRDDGPLHLIIIDTGEDKSDTTQVYAGLNAMTSYHDRELKWLEEEPTTSSRSRTAPFRVLLMHQPHWGWLGHGDQKTARAAWTAAANAARVDLVIAGHTHRFSLTPAGSPLGNDYPILVVGQGDVAKVDATATSLHVTVVAQDGSVRTDFTLHRADTH
jgi:predicted phosphodiesterase